jgi:hypothetical protein
LNSGLHASKANTQLLESHLQPFCSGYFGHGGHMNYLPRLALNHDPSYLGLQSSRITGVSHRYKHNVLLDD